MSTFWNGTDRDIILAGFSHPAEAARGDAPAVHVRVAVSRVEVIDPGRYYNVYDGSGGTLLGVFRVDPRYIVAHAAGRVLAYHDSARQVRYLPI